MATKKAEKQSNENIENNMEIKKEEVVAEEKVVKKRKTTTGTTKKATTGKKSTSKKNTEKDITAKKSTTTTRRKTSTNKKSEEKEQEGTVKENKIDEETQKEEVAVEENKKEEIIAEPKSKEKTKRTTKTTKKKEIVKEDNDEAKNIEEKQDKEEKKEEKKRVQKQPKVTKKEKNDDNNKNEIKEKTTTKKKTTKNNSKKVNARESKLKDLANKVNQFAIDEEIEIEEEREKEEIAPQPKLIKIEDIKKTIKNKKELPKEEKEKINKILFRNIIVAIIIIVYFMFLNLGKMNIENSVYTTDLKVFSMCTLLSAIVLIEIAYKKDSGEIALYGVEMIVLAIATFALIYVNLMLSSRYIYIVTAISFIFAIYYLIKSIVIYVKKKKQYFVDDIKEIMNKEEVE